MTFTKKGFPAGRFSNRPFVVSEVCTHLEDNDVMAVTVMAELLCVKSWVPFPSLDRSPHSVALQGNR